MGGRSFRRDVRGDSTTGNFGNVLSLPTSTENKGFLRRGCDVERAPIYDFITRYSLQLMTSNIRWSTSDSKGQTPKGSNDVKNEGN